MGRRAAGPPHVPRLQPRAEAIAVSVAMTNGLRWRTGTDEHESIGAKLVRTDSAVAWADSLLGSDLIAVSAAPSGPGPLICEVPRAVGEWV